MGKSGEGVVVAFEAVGKRKGATGTRGGPIQQQGVGGTSTPESAVLGLQQTAGNAATAEAFDVSTPGPGPELAQSLRTMHQGGPHGLIVAALGQIETVRNQIMGGIGMLTSIENYGAWQGMATSCVAMLDGVAATLGSAERMRDSTAQHAPAWVEGPAEAHAADFLERNLAVLRDKLTEWKYRLLAVAPMDVGTPMVVAGEMASVIAPVRAGLAMVESTSRG